MGKYDFVAMAEAPNDEAYMQLALTIGAQGNARTTTLKAWSTADGAEVIAKVQSRLARRVPRHVQPLVQRVERLHVRGL